MISELNNGKFIVQLVCLPSMGVLRGLILIWNFELQKMLIMKIFQNIRKDMWSLMIYS